MDQDKIEAVLLEYTIKDIENLIVEYIGSILVPNVDYYKSIQILKGIESQFEESEKMFEDSSETVKELCDSMYNDHNVDDVYSQQRHKLSIVSVKIDPYYECYARDYDELSLCPPDVMDLFDRRRGFVEIYNEQGPVFDISHGDNNDNPGYSKTGNFSAMMRLHNTSFGENAARIGFIYYDRIKAWILWEHFDEFTGVIDDNNEFLLLDFSRYK